MFILFFPIKIQQNVSKTLNNIHLRKPAEGSVPSDVPLYRNIPQGSLFKNKTNKN